MAGRPQEAPRALGRMRRVLPRLTLALLALTPAACGGIAPPKPDKHSTPTSISTPTTITTRRPCTMAAPNEYICQDGIVEGTTNPNNSLDLTDHANGTRPGEIQAEAEAPYSDQARQYGLGLTYASLSDHCEIYVIVKKGNITSATEKCEKPASGANSANIDNNSQGNNTATVRNRYHRNNSSNIITH